MGKKVKSITLIGTDSTHCCAFAKLLSEHKEWQWQIKYAVRDTRSHMELSRSRMPKIEAVMLNELGIEVVGEITTNILESTDAFIIASVDAALHLAQFQEICKTQKPIFIDKPLAYSSEEAKKIFNLAEQTQTPIFSCSSLRFSASLRNCINEWEKIGESLKMIELIGPMPIEDDVPGLFWYGIHTIESLLTILPKDFHLISVRKNQKKQLQIELRAESVFCRITGDLKGQQNFSGNLITDGVKKSYQVAEDEQPLYYYLLEQMIEFFENGVAPVKKENTLKVITLVEKINQFVEKVE